MHDYGESLEQILVQLSSRFASVDGGQIRSEIDHGLQAVARFLQATSYGLLEPLGDLNSRWVLTFRPPQGTNPSDAWSEQFLWDLLEAQSGDVLLRLRSDEPQPKSWNERSLLARSRPSESIIPICLGARILGVVSFDSHPSAAVASSEQLDEFRNIASVLAHGLQRKRTEEQLEDSLEFEHVLMNLTAALSRAPPSNIELALEEAAQHLAQALRLDQMSLLEVESGAEHPRTICAYNRSTASVTFPSGKQLREIHDRLLRGEFVRVADGRMLEPAESAPVDAPTLLFVPLASSRIHLCAVSPATRFNAPGGSELMPSRLALAGEILASAWARTRDQGKSAVLGSSAPRSRASPVYARECLAPEHAIEGVIGQSDVLRYVLFKVDQVARTDATTLLLGETGTGKGLIARAIHERSARRNRPLITVNCAALPNGLVETELFGHEKGSYTGAHRSQAGRFEVADRGTILLDEIGDLPLEFQAKLLRILQEGELERVGSTKTLSVDVRVIAATNRDLEEDVREGRFREDLYYRLNVFPITLPPLRDRPEDIPLLVRHFVDRLSVKLGKPIERIPDAVMKDLQAHSWPGNVRELESVLTRALIVTSDTTLRLAHHFVPPSEVRNAPGTEMREVERTHISAMLSRHSWRIEGTRGAASALGMRPSTLRGRMRKLQIQRPR